MKKIIITICFFMLAACKNSKSENETPIYADEAVLIVNYKLENMTLEEHAQLGAQVAPNFVSDSIPGLLGKSFIGNVDRGVFGGIYYFENEQFVSEYLDSELWKGVVAHPNLVRFKTEVFKTFNGSKIANGEHKSRKTSTDPSDSEGLSVLVVNFDSQPTEADISKMILEGATVFNNEKFPGFIGKTFISKSDTNNVFGGVYFFESMSSIESYLSTDFWNDFENSEGINVFKKDTYGVASISTISNGVPVSE